MRNRWWSSAIWFVATLAAGLRAQEPAASSGAMGPMGPIPLRELPSDAGRPDEPPRLDKGGPQARGLLPAGFLGDPYFLGFAGGLYRPPADEKLDPELAFRVARGPQAGESRGFTYGYVMFQGRITDQKMDRVRSLGVRLLRYHPNNAWAARIPVDQIVPLSELPEVRWIGLARAEQKLHPVLRWGLMTGALARTGIEPAGAIPVHVNLFESDLGDASVKVVIAETMVVDAGRPERRGDPRHDGWTWRTNGRVQAELERLGVVVLEYEEAIEAYRALATPQAISLLAGRDWVSFLEWAPQNEAAHDWSVPQVAQDFFRETLRVTTQTVGVIDSGFALTDARGPGTGHVDLNKWAWGWDYWGGGCGSPFCDEGGSVGFHGSHVLGTICGTGSANQRFRGNSPYLGTGGGAQRLFLVKGFTSQGYQHMRGPVGKSPRPVLVSNSWRAGACLNNPAGCTPPMCVCTNCVVANYVGSEAGARTLDAEVFNQNQLYVFAAGNEGTCNGGCGVGGTIGDPSTAKNALTVGNVQDDVTATGDPGSATCDSSRGPCADGRWKPNVAGPGCSIQSVNGGTRSGYSGKCGTSMATPAVSGVLAGAMERFGDLRASAPLARAWAMATAIPFRDATSSPLPGGWLPTAHLNTYGMGRISAFKAQDAGGAHVPWFYWWAWGDVQNETDTFDMWVGPDNSRMVLVLTWDDPAAAAGANPARVMDVDVYVDREPFDPAPNAGEWSSTSGGQTVEQVVLDNPPAGNYRVKIYPYTTTQRVRWGCLAAHLRGDTTPAGRLTTTADRVYLPRWGRSTVTVTATADSYLASNLHLQYDGQLGPNPLTLNSGETTLRDGVTAPQDANGRLTLGDVLVGNPRAARYVFQDDVGTDRSLIAQWSARSDNAPTTWPAAIQLTVDGTPPPDPTNLRSTTHQVGTWSTSRSFGFAWSQDPDNLAGIDGHSEAFGLSNPPGAPASVQFGPTTMRTVTSPFDGDLYYGLRTGDRSGNWSREVAVGPFPVDSVRPSQPGNLVSTTHTVNGWSTNRTMTFTWTPATDDRSGLAGYAASISFGGGADPGNTLSLGPSATTVTLTAPGDGPAWFNIKSRDVAGNWSNVASIGPFLLDTTPPQNVVLTLLPAVTTSLNVTAAIEVTPPEVGLTMRFRNDGGSFSSWEPVVASRPWNLSSGGGSTATGTRTVSLEVRDPAGNFAPASAAVFYYVALTAFGTACNGSLGQPFITRTGGGLPGIGRTITFTVTNTAATVGQLWLGLSNTSWAGGPLPMDLGPFNAPGCFLLVSPDAPLYIGPPGAVPIAIPLEPLLVGHRVYLQWVLLGDPGHAIVTTWGVAVTIAGA